MNSKISEALLPYGIRHSEPQSLETLEKYSDDLRSLDTLQIFSAPEGVNDYTREVEQLLGELEDLDLIIAQEGLVDQIDALESHSSNLEILESQNSRRDEIRAGKEIIEEYWVDENQRFGAVTWDYTVPRNNKELNISYPELDGPRDGFLVDFEGWNTGKDWLLNQQIIPDSLAYYLPTETGAWRSYRRTGKIAEKEETIDLSDYEIRDSDYVVFGMTYSDDFSDYAQKFWPQKPSIRDIFIEPEPARRMLPQFWKDLGKKLGGVEEF